MNPTVFLSWIKRAFAVALLIVLIFVVVAVVRLVGIYAAYTWALHKATDVAGLDVAIARPIALGVIGLSFWIPWRLLIFPWLDPKRRRGAWLASVAVAVVGSALMGFATRDVFFSRSDGQPQKFFIKTLNGFKFSDVGGTDSTFGVEFKPVTAEVYREYMVWKKRGTEADAFAAAGRNFDPLTGEPERWLAIPAEGVCQSFPLPGFHPKTGKKLIAVNPELIAECDKRDAEAKRHHEEEEATRRKSEEQEAKRAQLQRLAHPGRYIFGPRPSGMVDGFRFTFTEIDVLQDRILMHVEVANLGVESKTGPLLGPATFLKGNPPLRFGLVSSDGVTAVPLSIKRKDGALDEGRPIAQLGQDERGTIILEFSRRTDPVDSMSVTVNDQAIVSTATAHPRFRPY